MVFGCTGLIILKGRVDPTPSDAQMIIRDYGLLIALDLLGITGLLTLALRNTSFFLGSCGPFVPRICVLCHCAVHQVRAFHLSFSLHTEGQFGTRRERLLTW